MAHGFEARKRVSYHVVLKGNKKLLVYTHSVILVILKAIWLVRYLGLFNNIHLLASG